jgi:uridine phosphorylase
VLLPGDPGRALALAQEVLSEPRMFNHNRGLWGYTGVAADGELMTIQSTGIGGPSAAVVLEELVALGARRAIRVGTAAALDVALAPGGLLVVERALCGDGTSRALGGGDHVEGDAGLLAALRHGAGTGAVAASGTIVSSDLYHGIAEAELARWRTLGARAIDLASAALLALGARRGVAVGCVVAVVERAGGGERLSEAALHEAGLAVGRAGAAALLGA